MRLVVFVFETPSFFILTNDGDVSGSSGACTPITFSEEWSKVSGKYLEWISSELNKMSISDIEHAFLVFPHVIHTNFKEKEIWKTRLQTIVSATLSFHSFIEAVIGHLSDAHFEKKNFLLGNTHFGYSEFYNITPIDNNFEYSNITVRPFESMEILSKIIGQNQGKTSFLNLLHELDETYEDVKRHQEDALDLPIKEVIEKEVSGFPELSFRDAEDLITDRAQTLSFIETIRNRNGFWFSTLFNYGIIKSNFLKIFNPADSASNLLLNSVENTNEILAKTASGLLRVFSMPELIRNNGTPIPRTNIKASFNEGPIIGLTPDNQPYNSARLISLPIPLPPLKIHWQDKRNLQVENWFPEQQPDFTHLGKSYKLFNFYLERSSCGEISLECEDSNERQATVTIQIGCQLNHE